MWPVSKAPPSTVAGSSLIINNFSLDTEKLDITLEKFGRLEELGFLRRERGDQWRVTGIIHVH